MEKRCAPVATESGSAASSAVWYSTDTLLELKRQLQDKSNPEEIAARRGKALPLPSLEDFLTVLREHGGVVDTLIVDSSRVNLLISSIYAACREEAASEGVSMFAYVSQLSLTVMPGGLVPAEKAIRSLLLLVLSRVQSMTDDWVVPVKKALRLLTELFVLRHSRLTESPGGLEDHSLQVNELHDAVTALKRLREASRDEGVRVACSRVIGFCEGALPPSQDRGSLAFTVGNGRPQRADELAHDVIRSSAAFFVSPSVSFASSLLAFVESVLQGVVHGKKRRRKEEAKEIVESLWYSSGERTKKLLSEAAIFAFSCVCLTPSSQGKAQVQSIVADRCDRLLITVASMAKEEDNAAADYPTLVSSFFFFATLGSTAHVFSASKVEETSVASTSSKKMEEDDPVSKGKQAEREDTPLWPRLKEALPFLASLEGEELHLDVGEALALLSARSFGTSKSCVVLHKSVVSLLELDIADKSAVHESSSEKARENFQSFIREVIAEMEKLCASPRRQIRVSATLWALSIVQSLSNDDAVQTLFRDFQDFFTSRLSDPEVCLPFNLFVEDFVFPFFFFFFVVFIFFSIFPFPFIFEKAKSAQGINHSSIKSNICFQVSFFAKHCH